MALPLLRLRGSPYEQGLQHGFELRDEIVHNLEVYFSRFQAEARIAKDEVLARAERYAGALARLCPDHAAGMRGIADGSGRPFAEIAALNVRYEIHYHQVSANARGGGRAADGCTSFAVLPSASANGRLLMGQNWDWIPEVKAAATLVRGEDGLCAALVTEAGMFGGKIGLNSAGIGLAVNGLHTADDDWSRLRRPFQARCAEILRSRDFEAALRVVADEERSCSTNFLIGQAPDRAADLEAAPRAVRKILPGEDGILAHANHFTDAAGLGVEEIRGGGYPHSRRRHERILSLLLARRPLGVADLMEILKDHEGRPYSVCRHADPDGDPSLPFVRRDSVVSVIMDLADRRMWVSDGPPCRAPYQEIRLD